MSELVQLICQAQDKMERLNQSIEHAKRELVLEQKSAQDARLSCDSLQRNMSRHLKLFIEARLKHAASKLMSALMPTLKKPKTKALILECGLVQCLHLGLKSSSSAHACT
jgi:hypothetical protein